MNELPIGSLWRPRHHAQGMRMILSVCKAHNPHNGVMLVSYHDIDTGERLCLLATVGEWTYDWEMVSA